MLRSCPSAPPGLVGALLGAALLSVSSTARAYEGAPAERPPPAAARVPTLTKAPALTHFVDAVYPEAAERAGLTGEVELFIDIAADGQVAGAEVSRPAGHGFDEAALAAVRQFRFTPAEIDGAPAPVRIGYTYRFVLRPPQPAAPASGRQAPPAVRIRGRALERGTRAPLVGATAACLEHAGEEAITDPDGRFALHVPPGRCTLQLVSYRHEPLARVETLRADEILEVTYYLMPRLEGLFQSVVRGARERREATTHSLAREELQKAPGSLGDPIRVLQNLPGVARVPYVGGALLVRGAWPSDTGAYLDGVEVPLLFHFLGGPSVINAEFLDDLDFNPGGFGPQYGRAIGGIVDAHTRRGADDGMHGSFKIDLVDSAAFFEAPVSERTTVAVAARRSYVDLLLPSVLPKDPQAGAVSVLPRYWDYQLRADHGEAGAAHHFSVMAFGSDDQLALAVSGGRIASGMALDANTRFHRLRFAWSWKGATLSHTFAPYVGYDTVVAQLGEGLDAEGARTSGPLVGLRDELRLQLPGANALRVGTDLQLAQTRFSATIPGDALYRAFPGSPVADPSALSRTLNALDLGFYLQLELQPLRGLTLLPGVRMDAFRLHQVSRTAVDPRLVARLQAGERTVLKGAIGHYSMAPEPTQFDPDYGNPGLRTEKAFQTSLGVERKLAEALSLEVTGFFNRQYDDIVSSDRVIEGPDGTFRAERYGNDGLGRAYGLEFLLRHDISERFFGWISYTLSRSEIRRVGGIYKLHPYDEPHILAAVAQYKLGKGWEVGGRFRLVSGRPTTPVQGAVFDADTGEYRAVRGAPNSLRLPLFQQLDARVDKTWTFERWRLGAYLDVQNVYWAQNAEAEQWDYRYRTRTVIPGMPILPTFGVKGAF